MILTTYYRYNKTINLEKELKDYENDEAIEIKLYHYVL